MVSSDIELVPIGIFGKPVGFNGDTYLYLNDDIELVKPSHLFIKIEGLKVPFRIEKYKQSDKDIKVKIASFDTKESVAALKSSKIYCEQKYVTFLETPEGELVGYKLYRGEEEYIGDVLEVEDHGLNSLLKVSIQSGNVVYVPYHADLIVSLNEIEKVIKMNIAEGLLTL